MSTEHAPYIIAEVANSHNGSPASIIKLIESLKSLGYSQAIKFQPFSASLLAESDYAPGLYEPLEIAHEEWIKIIQFAHSSGLKVFLDIFDDFGINILSCLSDIITGFKVQSGSLFASNVLQAIFAQKFSKHIKIINVMGIDNNIIYEIAGNIQSPENLMIQFGIQEYPTVWSKSFLSELHNYKQLNLSISYADHLGSNLKSSLILSGIMYANKVFNIEKHICLKASDSKYDSSTALEPREFAEYANEVSIAFSEISKESQSLNTASASKYFALGEQKAFYEKESDSIVFRRSKAISPLSAHEKFDLACNRLFVNKSDFISPSSPIIDNSILHTNNVKVLVLFALKAHV